MRKLLEVHLIADDVVKAPRLRCIRRADELSASEASPEITYHNKRIDRTTKNGQETRVEPVPDRTLAPNLKSRSGSRSGPRPVARSTYTKDEAIHCMYVHARETVETFLVVVGHNHLINAQRNRRVTARYRYIMSGDLNPWSAT
ncbi:hypothetical protein EVAR_55394_1 [Eumeta japonica]|uniref:Uncharacterized protein n=1 Tax=Eumeta variegata TaxID=151549 RepID=A0A4C1YRE4_EUMVA|nr:hypothetical protein EVAR_55394_1 [Eumeta japonica]